MTQNNPMQDVYKCVLHTYNPLHIKDILIHGASRKAIHHNLLDAKEKYCKDYLFMQWCYNQTDKTQEDQFEFLRDVVWLYIDCVADELGDEYELKTKDRQTIEDEVLAIDLQFRKNQLSVIDGGKA